MKLKATFAWLGVVLLAAVLAGVVWWSVSRPKVRVIQVMPTAAQTPDAGFSYERYADVLSEYVDDRGMVNYQGLKASRGALDAFAGSLAGLSAREYGAWDEPQQIALWINAYNALTLVAIVEHYPIKASLAASLRFPRNSIRQIPGVWDKLQFVIMGRKMTLDDIEHQELRKHFDEPRIHVALVCAARGCPPLRGEPFVGERLDAQLDGQARRFLSNREKFRIDREKGRVYLSPIFKWFGKDFVKSHGTDEKFSGHSEAPRAVLNFVSGYLSEEDRAYLTTGNYRMEHLDYDWSLNEQ